MLKYDISRISWRKYVIVSMAVIFTLIVLSHLDVLMEAFEGSEPLEAGWTIRFLTEALTGQEMLFAAPILSSLPYAASFVEDYQSGMIRFILIRETGRRYLRSKILAVALSGGCVIAAGILPVIFCAFLILGPAEETEIVGQMEKPAFAVMLAMVCRYFFFGVSAALFGLYVSVKSRSRWMAWLAAFMGEYLMIIFVERFYPSLYIIYPKEWLLMSQAWPAGTWSVCLWLMLLAVLFAGLFCRTALRRLEDV